MAWPGERVGHERAGPRRQRVSERRDTVARVRRPNTARTCGVLVKAIASTSPVLRRASRPRTAACGPRRIRHRARRSAGGAGALENSTSGVLARCVELQAHAAGLEVEAAECGDDAGRGRHCAGSRASSRARSSARAGLGPRVILAHPGERLRKPARAQVRASDAGEMRRRPSRW